MTGHKHNVQPDYAGPGIPGTEGHTAKQPTQEEVAVAAALKFHHLMKMQDDRAFDYSHPVDEYQPQGLSTSSTSFPNQLIISPDYDMPERIEAIFAIISVGATLATLQLGQRTFTIYSGVALTTPLILSLETRGIILNSDDQRVFTLTGALTTAPYIGLTGFALTRGQFS